MGGFCLGNPTREGEKGEDWPYFVLERSGGGIRPSRRKGCDFAVLRTRCGIPPPRVNPDGAGPAAGQTRGNEATFLFAPALDLPSSPPGSGNQDFGHFLIPFPWSYRSLKL